VSDAVSRIEQTDEVIVPEDVRDQLLLTDATDDELNQYILEPMKRTGPIFWIVVAILAAVFVWGLMAWLYQIRWGFGVAGINRPVYWGMYITTFVFWVGISHAGTMISAVLRVFKADWRRSITRGAEAMTAFALLMAGLFPLIHVGRIWKVYWMVPYPNNRQLWPNFQSPLMWDMIAITTYLVASGLYLYLALIPDLAMARDNSEGWRYKLYRILAIGWRGTEPGWHKMETALGIFAIVIIPIFLSVHSIVSWDFGVTNQPRWHSTIFPVFFIIGAVYSGLAALAAILVVIRKTMGLQFYLRKEHLNNIGKLVMVAGLSWLYIWFAGFIVEWYGNMPVVKELLHDEISGDLAPLFWTMMVCNVTPIIALMFKKVRTTPALLLFFTLMINVGMFIERFLIVVGNLLRNYLPYDWGDFRPTWVSLSIVIMTFAGFCLLYLLFTRLIPYVPVWEVKQGRLRFGTRRVGRVLVPTITQVD
jgi:molybdopterin-containing oxidoreductase family membrane subunit